MPVSAMTVKHDRTSSRIIQVNKLNIP